MPLIFGWGGDLKPVADTGIMKCPNCKNYTPWQLRKLTKAIRVYFIPVIPYSTKHYFVCSVCEAAFEADENKVKEVLAQTAGWPSNEECLTIWDALDATVARLLGAVAAGGDVNALERVIDEMTAQGFAKEKVQFVAPMYFQMLSDDDLPE